MTQASIGEVTAEIEGSRARAALMCCALVPILVGVAAMLIRARERPDADALGLGALTLATVVVAAGLVFYLGRLIHPDRLMVGGEGFAWRSLGRTRAYSWDEVRDFQPFVLSRDVVACIAFSCLAATPAGQQAWRSAMMPAEWRASAQEVANLLNAGRAAWAGPASRPARRRPIR